MSLALVTAAAAEPLSLTEAKLHLRVDDTADDALITVLLAAARQWVEEECRRSLMPQAWRLTLDRFPSRALLGCYGSGRYDGGRAWRADADLSILLRRGPVTAISSIKYLDAITGAQQTLGAGTYILDAASQPAAAVLAYGASWPATRELGSHGAVVTVDYATGYADAASVPAPLKAAILLLLGDLYANREGQIVGTITSANPTVAALIAPYRVVEAV